MLPINHRSRTGRMLSIRSNNDHSDTPPPHYAVMVFVGFYEESFSEDRGINLNFWTASGEWLHPRMSAAEQCQ